MEPLTLNLVPSCPNCLAWSADGILAIAAGDVTQLLVPKISDKDLTTEEQNLANENFKPSLWHSVRLHTNQFTFQEWPCQDPLSFENFSVGEEQSLSKLVGLKWSPEGLGKYRRCVLAVLTSNCVLSLWEADQHPMEAASWKRVGVVNDALRDYFNANLDRSTGEDSEELQELKKKKKRIRAFDWSQEYYCESQDTDNEEAFTRMDEVRFNQCAPSKDPPWRVIDGIEAPEIAKGTTDDRKWGVFYMAITNDDNDIVFARLYRERRTPNVKSLISVEILSHVHLTPSLPRGPTLSSEYSLSNILATPSHIRQISWGPWSEGGTRRYGGWTDRLARNLHASSLISFIQGARLHFYRIKLTEVRKDRWSEIGENEIFFDSNRTVFVHKTMDLSTESFHGTVLWCRDRSSIACRLTETGKALLGEGFNEQIDHYHLVATSSASVTLFTFPSKLYCHDHEKSEGCEFCDDDEDEAINPLKLEVSRRDLTSKKVGQSKFQRTLWDQVMGVAFTSSEMTDERECILNAATTSSCSEILKIAIPDPEGIKGGGNCLTLEPSNEADWIRQIESAKDKFDREHDLGGLAVAKISGLASNGKSITACFTLHPGDMVEYITPAYDIATVVFAENNPDKPEFSISLKSWASSSIKSRSFMSDPYVLGADQDTVMKHMTQKDEDHKLLKQNEVAEAYVLNILIWVLFSVQPGTKVARDGRSLQIAYNAIHSLSELELQWGTERLTRLIRLKDMLHNAKQWIFQSNVDGSVDEPHQEEYIMKEHCNICEAELAWHTFEEARCENNHFFKRCALTLLAIQEPGISKFCASCEREYLNEEEMYHEHVKEQKKEEKRSAANAESAKEFDTNEAENRSVEVATQGASKKAAFAETLLWKMGIFFDVCPFCHGKFYN